MTNEEAKKELSKLIFELGFEDNVDDRVCALNMAIKALEQEPKWTPVSERLPEDRRAVLVTAYWHETYQVMMASYYGDGLWWCVPFNNCGEHMQRLKPKAWMPLPKPYEPQNVVKRKAGIPREDYEPLYNCENWIP